MKLKMTPQEALEHLITHFVERFGEDAEGCTDPNKTHAAVVTLRRVTRIRAGQ